MFALQSVAMSALNAPATGMALSGLSGKERVDGSAIFNTMRQISSSLASTLSVLIFAVAGSDIAAAHVVYGYHGMVAAAIAVLGALFLLAERREGKVNDTHEGVTLRKPR